MKTATIVLTALASSLLSACGGAGAHPAPQAPGGGGAAGPAPGAGQLQLTTTPESDGSASSDGRFIPNRAIRVGDGNADETWVALFQFDLSQLAPDALITHATLVIDQVGGSGSPYDDLAAIFVEIIDAGDSLDAADYGARRYFRYDGEPFISDNAPGIRKLDVTSVLRRLYTRVQIQKVTFRLSFKQATDLDRQSDLALLMDSEDSLGIAAIPPTLELTVE